MIDLVVNDYLTALVSEPGIYLFVNDYLTALVSESGDRSLCE